jgi:hypothetical protein
VCARNLLVSGYTKWAGFLLIKGAVLCNIRFEHYSTVQQEKAFSVEPDQPSQIPSKPAQAGFIFASGLFLVTLNQPKPLQFEGLFHRN